MRKGWLTILAVCVIGAPAPAAELFPPATGWQLSGQAEVGEFAGRTAIRVRNGRAELSTPAYLDATFDFDVYFSGGRAFPDFMFRGEAEGDYEVFYFRPHKSGLPDALQYAPVFQRRSAWQLYTGEHGTAAATLPAGTWIPVRVTVTGGEARMWVGDLAAPAMVIEQLGRAPRAGWIGFRGFVPGDDLTQYAAYVSNVRVTRLAGNDAPPQIPAFAPNQLLAWRISPVFEAPAGAVTALPAGVEDGTWTVEPATPRGMLEFLRYRQIAEDSRHWAVAADIDLQAPRAQTCALHLGFSDELTLSVNGRLIVYQNAQYRFGEPRQEGIMHADQLVVFVPLERGRNRLRAVVADQFGGWGLMGRLEGCSDVTVVR